MTRRPWGQRLRRSLRLRLVLLFVLLALTTTAIFLLGMQHALSGGGPEVPLVGFFAAGEVARHHVYGYTGVLTVFTGHG